MLAAVLRPLGFVFWVLAQEDWHACEHPKGPM